MSFSHYSFQPQVGHVPNVLSLQNYLKDSDSQSTSLDLGQLRDNFT